nr:Chain A, pip9 [synthetic construct]
VDIHVWDGV